MSSFALRALRSSIHKVAPMLRLQQLHRGIFQTLLLRLIPREFSTSPSTAAYLFNDQKKPPKTYASPKPPSTSINSTTSHSDTTPSSNSSSSAIADDTSANTPPITDLSQGLFDTPPLDLSEEATGSQPGPRVDWTRSYQGLSSQAFSKEEAAIFQAPIDKEDIEIKPDGVIYLPEIKYRRILNQALGPGGWGLAPRGETMITGRTVTREYALIAHGRLVSIARGEQNYYSPEGIATATEGCKSNALMRCCKDLGIASELWDPRYIRTFLKERAKQIWVEHAPTKKKRQLWLRKEDEPKFPFVLSKPGA